MPERTPSVPAAAAGASLPSLPSLLVAVGLFAFVSLHVASAVAYPGGTFCNANAPRYELFGNFFCDLTRPQTPLGLDNALSARLATAAFAAVALALGPFWWLLGRQIGGRSGRAVFWLGALSAAATIALGYLPSSHWPMVHVTTVFTAAIPGLAAAVLGVVGLLAAGRRAPALAGAAVLLAGLGDAVGYAHAVWAHIHCAPYLPALQKLAAIGLVAWMSTVAAIGTPRPAAAVAPPAARRRPSLG